MITPDQQSLIDVLTRALEADPRIESVWLYGSIARGVSDPWSDVDLVAVVAESALASVVKAYSGDLSAIANIVHSQVLYGRLIHAVTVDWARFDITFVAPAELGPRDTGAHQRLFARDGAAAPAGAAAPVRAATATDIEALSREFIRVLGLAPVGFGRCDFVMLLEGGVLLRTMLIDLMLAETGRARSERGAKRLTDMLTPAQIEVLESLPPLIATRDSAFAFNLTLAKLFLPRAKALASKLGATWPTAFEEATRTHLQRALGLFI